MPPEIFASYSREDQAQIFPIVDKLRERPPRLHHFLLENREI
jgi:hypothetical protein